MSADSAAPAVAGPPEVASDAFQVEAAQAFEIVFIHPLIYAPGLKGFYPSLKKSGCFLWCVFGLVAIPR